MMVEIISARLAEIDPLEIDRSLDSRTTLASNWFVKIIPSGIPWMKWQETEYKATPPFIEPNMLLLTS
jgi:hypothetical protein